MFNLEHTERFSAWDKHKTWTRIGDEAPRVSSLQNQFALHEFQMSEAEALAKYRVWLWGELQDGDNVVGKEMKALVRAHLASQAVAVLVPIHVSRFSGETIHVFTPRCGLTGY